MKQFTTKTRLARAAMTLLVALLTTTTAWAQETTLTVYDGTGNSGLVPFYGLYADTQGTASECVIPSDELTAMAGGTITAMKFYLKQSAQAAWTGTHQVYIGEVNATTLTGITGPSSFTVVKTASFDATGTELTVEFDEPYPYNGGNLLIGTFVSVKGNYKSAYFYGVTQTENTGWYRSSASATGTGVKFIPKTTFTYTPGNGVALPATLTATNVTTHEATLTWTGGTSTYNVEYKKKADTDWTPVLANTTLTTHTLNGLTPNTDYQARVQSVGANDVSIWRTVSFKTLISCPAPTDLTVTLTPGNGSIATLSWTENGIATQWEICLNDDEANLTTVTSLQCSENNGQWSIELTGLTAEQAYTAKIRAVNSADDKSEWTDAISFTPTNAYLFTVYEDGTATNSYVPVYGFWADKPQRAEFIIPASELAALSDKTLKSMKFYADYNFTSTGSFQVYIKEVSESAFSGTDFYTAEGATTVYTGTVTVSSTDGMTINFSEDFDYGGGNLLVGFYQATGGNYIQASSTKFYGVEATGASISYYSSNSATQRNFLPKVTFGYSNNLYKKPKSLTLGAITNNTAIIGWTAPNGDVTGYQYQYKPEGGSWTELASTTELTATLTGLTGNTTYTFQVKAIYSAGESDFASTTFTTECNAFSIPYTYGFEDAGDMNCWTISDVYGRTVIDNGSSFGVSAKTGDYFFVFEYKDYPDTDPQYMTLITPELTGIENALHVEFYYRTDVDYEETFRVGYSTTDHNLSSFTWGSPISSTTTEYQLFRANYPAGTKYVAVQHLSDDKDFLIFDDFSFTEASACLEPSDILASDITTTGANLSWTTVGSETAWDIYLTDDLADVPGDGTTPTYANVTSNVNYPISGLVSGTPYYVYVRSACDETEHSAWSNRATFNTVCKGLALPYSYNFEDDALPVCWTTISTDEGWNIFTISDTDPQQGSKHLNLYCKSTNEYQYVVLPEIDASYPLNEYEITFYSKLAGTNTTGRTLAVGVMTDPTDATTFVQVGEAFTPPDAYAQYKVRLNTYTGNGQYIAIKHTISSSGNTYIDNLEVKHLPSCLEPEGLASSNITGHTADLSWTGFSDAYKVDYRTVAYIDGIEENFSTDPAGWIKRTGELNADGTATLSENSSWNRGTYNSVFDSHIYMNLYNTKNYWLITPSMEIKDGDVLGFDVAYTAYSGTQASPIAGCETHRFAVLISTDEMTTWTILREWNNSGSGYVLDDISNTGEAINPIDLSAYAGATAYIAFFGHSEVNNYDNNLHFDNVVIGPPVAEGQWQTATADEEHCTLTGLAAETEYDVRVQGNCGSDGESEWTEVLTFTTTVACPTPTNVTISNIKNHSAVVSWESGNDQFNLMLGEEVIPNVTNPYTLTNLTPVTQYSVKVQSVCGGEDGESEWTTAESFTTIEANPVPTALAVTNLTTTTATLSWTENSDDATGWVVAYKTEDDTEYTEITEVTENPYTLTGLTSETVYTAKVRAVKGEETSDWSSEISFEPTVKTIIGSGTETDTYFPTYTYYEYSYTQQIYTAEELGTAGLFESIDFYMTSDNDYTRNLDIYMVSTDKNAFENNYDWIAVTDDDLVFSGDVNFKAKAWTTIMLDNVFNYDGTQNVAIIVDDNTNTWNSFIYFRTFTASANQSHYCYQDDNDIDPSSPSASSNATTNSKNQIRIMKIQLSDCMKPLSLKATEVGPYSATLSWKELGSATEWVIDYNSTTVNVTENPYTLRGLSPETSYTVKVRPACSESLWSKEITFITSSFDVTLADNATDNASKIEIYDGILVNVVTLSGRTLYGDGYWNTFCVPFDLSASQIAASPIAGADIMALDTDNSGFDDGTLTLNFATASNITAGTSYLIKWNGTEYDTNGRMIINSIMDWNNFAAKVNGGETTLNAVLNADITGVTTMVGTNDNRYAGTFDGTASRPHKPLPHPSATSTVPPSMT